MPTVFSHDTTAPLPSDLSKLNVSQLKAICKDRRIVGYSKLGKAALLSKLRELPTSLAPSARPQSGSSLLNSGPSHPPLDDSPVPVPAAAPGVMGPPSLLPNLLESASNKVPGANIPQISVASISTPSRQPPSCLSGGRGKRHSPSVSSPTGSISKRVSAEISQDQAHADPSAKRLRVAASSALRAGDDALHLPHSTCSQDILGVVCPPVPALSCSPIVPRIKEGIRNQLDPQTRATATAGKRFKPLKVMRPPLVPSYYRKEAQLSSSILVHNVTAEPTLLWHLDFPPHPEFPLLSPITFPPPLSQRKLVQRWVIILSSLSDRERSQCCLVSRLIRYAGKRQVPEHIERIHTRINSLFIGAL
jgi:hypothetical protein